jgi:hypothetical protein
MARRPDQRLRADLSEAICLRLSSAIFRWRSAASKLRDACHKSDGLNNVDFPSRWPQLDGQGGDQGLKPFKVIRDIFVYVG